MGVLSAPLRCPGCRALVQHAEAAQGPAIVVEPGNDPHGDVVVTRAGGRLRARLVHPGETIPRTQARLVQHHCADARPLPAGRPAGGEPLEVVQLQPTAAMVATVAALLQQGYPVDPATARAVAVLVDAGFDVEPIGLVSPCSGACGRTVTHPPNDRPLCANCPGSPARRRTRRR